MPVEVKDVGMASRKFVTRGQAAGGDYTEGVRGSGQRWQANASASAENYNAGVQQAITRGSFAKGVNEAGGGKYEQKATTLGAQRFPQGIAQAGPAWAEGTGPYLDTIRGLNLPPRRPRGDPANYLRNQAIGEALRRRKVGG